MKDRKKHHALYGVSGLGVGCPYCAGEAGCPICGGTDIAPGAPGGVCGISEAMGAGEAVDQGAVGVTGGWGGGGGV